MKKRLKIGLISHLVRDYNLGCSALAISNISLMDSVFKKNNIDVEYVVLLAEPKEDLDLFEYTSLKGFTDFEFSYRTYPRLKPVLKNPSLIKKEKSFDGLDYIVDLCGGDGYTDSYGMIRLLAESLPVLLAKQQNIPFVFGPQTIGPFNKKIGNFVAKKTLNNSDYVFVRDQRSFDCCNKLKIKTDVTQVIDVAFALPYKNTYDKSSMQKIGINVSGLLYNGGYDKKNYFGLSFSYKDFIHRLIEKLSEYDNVQIHLVPHVISDTVEIDDDYRVCKTLSEQYKNVVLSPKFNNPINAKSYISQMDLFTGARMHSTIGAISSGVPVVPVAYSRKFNGLYNTLQYPYFIDAKSNISLDDALDTFIEYYKNIQKLKDGVAQAKEIYTAGLNKYKDSLETLFNLNGE